MEEALVLKLFVGYQLCNDDSFLRCILAQREKIGEVYFSWDTMPSGRSAVGLHQDLFPWEAAKRQRDELQAIADAGIGLNLLLNANCYGGQSLARSFFQTTGDLVNYLCEQMNLVSVTTTSPVIGRFVRENFPQLEVRASVNMEIGSEEGMDYLGDCFTSFYAKRELNRDIPALQRLRRWCDTHGKKLDLLANSGCLNNCSARQFHDNLVAHEQEIAKMDNAFEFHSVCRQYLASPEHRAAILRLSNWIRPEDLHHYEDLADGVKLATRTSPNPVQTLLAYTSGRYEGNMLDLLEPNYAHIFYPAVLDNTAFPPDYFAVRHNCSHDCGSCGYCVRIYQTILRALPDIMLADNDMDTQEEKEKC